MTSFAFVYFCAWKVGGWVDGWVANAEETSAGDKQDTQESQEHVHLPPREE